MPSASATTRASRSGAPACTSRPKGVKLSWSKVAPSRRRSRAYSGSEMNGSSSRSVASGEDRGERGVAPPPQRREPEHERPEEELERDRDAEREARDREPVAEPPGHRDEQAEEQRHVGRSHLADHRSPQQRCAVDAPVANTDDPQSREERDDAEHAR